MPTKTAAEVATTPVVGPETRPNLTETEVLGVALEIIDEHGIDGLTMRQLSSRLGVVMLAMRAVLTGAGFSEAAVDDALMTLFFSIAGTLVGGFTTMGKSPAQVREMRLRFERGLDVILRGIQAELA